MKLKQTFAVLLAAGALVLTACTPRGAASSCPAAHRSPGGQREYRRRANSQQNFDCLLHRR